jgi:hypothetical protein
MCTVRFMLCAYFWPRKEAPGSRSTFRGRFRCARTGSCLRPSFATEGLTSLYIDMILLTTKPPPSFFPRSRARGYQQHIYCHHSHALTASHEYSNQVCCKRSTSAVLLKAPGMKIVAEIYVSAAVQLITGSYSTGLTYW